MALGRSRLGIVRPDNFAEGNGELKGLGFYGEGLDSMKVAQCEVLGNEAKGQSVPLARKLSG